MCTGDTCIRNHTNQFHFCFFFLLLYHICCMVNNDNDKTIFEIICIYTVYLCDNMFKQKRCVCFTFRMLSNLCMGQILAGQRSIKMCNSNACIYLRRPRAGKFVRKVNFKKTFKTSKSKC